MSLELQTLECLRHRLNNLRSRSVAALEQLTDADVNWRANEVIGGLTPDRLRASLRINGEQVATLQHLVTVATHFAEHVGQILYIAKLRLGPAYRVISQ